MRWYAKDAAVGALGLLLMGFGVTLRVPAGAEAIVSVGAVVVGVSVALLMWRASTRLRRHETR
jgi:protein-S-isoprenylcysteine O-methyltransferase Ste14